MINSEIFNILPKLKICGFKKCADLQISLGLGVDFVGFNFYEGSKRFVEPEAAGEMWQKVCSQNTHQTLPVAVVVRPTEADVARIAASFPGGIIWQFHGGETPEIIDQLTQNIANPVIWQAIPVGRSMESYEDLRHPACQLTLFDHGGTKPQEFGGQGQAFDWQLLQQQNLPERWGLAGGVNLENFDNALDTGAHVIDVASGAEVSPGIKDSEIMQQMVQSVHAKRR